ncbi:hypothetical protein IRJ41_016941 [Triplophysa rosa]|uniref:Uncharacterized protein n=1 Tax=Triplophysa rosa TaxID=992332 RepID=A0A9W7W9C7_TRIRA|nr:hypothetical protein IRJ41_016941 [Triplophysa rosa]
MNMSVRVGVALSENTDRRRFHEVMEFSGVLRSLTSSPLVTDACPCVLVVMTPVAVELRKMFLECISRSSSGLMGVSIGTPARAHYALAFPAHRARARRDGGCAHTLQTARVEYVTLICVFTDTCCVV